MGPVSLLLFYSTPTWNKRRLLYDNDNVNDKTRQRFISFGVLYNPKYIDFIQII